MRQEQVTEQATSRRRLLISNAADAAGRNLADFTLDLIFIGALGATAMEMGLLNALGSVAFVLASIPAGNLVDRYSAVKILRLGLLAKTVLLLCLLVLTITGLLSIPMGMALATMLGFCNVFSETSQMTAVPALSTTNSDTPNSSIATLTARLTAADQSMAIVIPAIVGTAFALFGAPPLLAAAVALGLAASALAWMIKGGVTSRNVAVPKKTDASLANSGIFSGVGYVMNQRKLRALTLAMMFSNLGLAIGSTVEGIFIINELDLGPQGFGAYSAVAGAGGLVGALLAARVATKYSTYRLGLVTLCAQVVLSGAVLAAAFTPLGWAIALLLFHALTWGLVVIVFNVSVASWVAELTPERFLGRVTSARRLFTFGVVPLGSLLGGALGTGMGIRVALAAWVASCTLGLLSFLFLRTSDRDSHAPPLRGGSDRAR